MNPNYNEVKEGIRHILDTIDDHAVIHSEDGGFVVFNTKTQMHCMIDLDAATVLNVLRDNNVREVTNIEDVINPDHVQKMMYFHKGLQKFIQATSEEIEQYEREWSNSNNHK